MSDRTKAVMQESVRRWAVDEAREIEKMSLPPVKITMADLYARHKHGESATARAEQLEVRLFSVFQKLAEIRWGHVERICAEYGVKL